MNPLKEPNHVHTPQFAENSPCAARTIFPTPKRSRSAEHKVRMQSMRFSPVTLTIKAGDSVVFENRGPMEHTATSKDKSWDTGNLRKGKSATITFPNKGTHKYDCRWHSAMQGTIIVE